MNDLTLRALTAQLKAMGCAQYEFGIHDSSSGKVMNKSWSVEKLLSGEGKKAPPWRWLKHMNVSGNDIWVRPAGTWHHLVLVDDLKSDTLERMRRDGVEPALVVETSPANFQAWVSVAQPSRKILPPEIRRVIAQRLMREYGGDPGSADAKHYGRLAGFTNRKPKYRTPEGHYPWVLLHEHGGQPASAAAELVAVADAELQKEEQHKGELEQREQERQAEVQQIAVQARSGNLRDPVVDFLSEMRGLVNRFGAEIADPGNSRWTMSKCDFVISAKMLRRGHSADAIELAMREASPDIDQRKAGHVEDYVRRTIEAAAAAVDRDGAPVARSNPSAAVAGDTDLDEFLSVTSGSGRSRPGPG